MLVGFVAMPVVSPLDEKQATVLLYEEDSFSSLHTSEDVRDIFLAFLIFIITQCHIMH